MRLSELGARVDSGEVKLRGKVVAVRALSFAEVADIVACIPEPPAPLGPVPGMGSLARAPDYADELWQAQCRRTRSTQRALEVAVGLGLLTAAGQRWDARADLAAKRAYLQEMAAEVQGSGGLSDDEIGLVYQRMRELERGAETAALKNSSGGAAAGGAEPGQPPATRRRAGSSPTATR